MSKVFVYNHKSKIIKATLNVASFKVGARNRDAYLKRLHEKKYWLMCGCVKPNAIMYPRLQENRYQLVNDPVKGKHHYKCPLFTQISGKRTQKSEQPQSVAVQPSSFTPVTIAIINQPPAATGKKALKGRKSLHVKKENSIHTLLLFALSQAKLDVLHDTKVYDLKNLYKTDVFKIPVCKSPGKDDRPITVGDITFVSPDEDGVQWKSIVQSKSERFNANVPLQAFIVKVVDGVIYDRVSESVTIFKDGCEEIQSCSRVTQHYERTRGPRIIFSIYAILDNKWSLVAIYTHPIVARNIPVLVDSSIERKFAQMFLDYRDPNLRLYKYYHGVLDKGIVLLPDFRLTNCTPGNYWSEIIEVMGLVNVTSYEERKKYIVPAMVAKYQLPVRLVYPASLSTDCRAAIKSVKKGNRE